ncbi:hypothetical protein MAR_023956 [Mya arenaria]|uniref:Uncharacterized protein n=1 Tax=Mya arenaria TaxID=6604 RepID=A0ABY7DTZ8_MYAAR|nr:hypothetical protein MAR_023956 [Mya arenaria]
MDDYLRWMTRKDSDRRAVILKQTLIDNDITMDKWLKQNQHCNDKDILAKRSEYFDLNQDEIYQLQQKQQENKRNIEYLKKRNDELWTKNDELVNENRFQEKKLDGYDLDLKHQLKKVDKLEQHINDNASYTEHIEYLLTQQQARNKSLKNEVSRLNALVGKLVNREHLGTNRIQREKEENQTLRREIIDLELEAAALRKELITLQGRYDRMSKCREGSATSVNRHERSGICSQKTTHKKSPKPGRSLIRENAMSFKAVDTLNRYDVNSLERERELFHAKINELENQLHSLRRERDSLYDELNKTVLPGSEHSNHFWREIQVVQPNTTYQHNEVSSSKHNPDDKLARSQLNRQLISCRQEKRLANDKIQEQEYIIRRLREEKEKLIQENRKQRSYYKEMAMHFQQDTEKREQKTQSVLNEELENDRSKTAVLSIEINKSAEILHEVTKELESEKSRNAILLTKSNQYREKMKQAYVDLSNYHAPLMQENRQSTERTATENNQQLERSLFDLFRLNEDMKGEVGSLNDKATKLTDTIEEKDKNISKLQSELQRKYQEIADRQGDLVLLKETNVKNERLISDLQTEMKQFQMKFKETSPDSERITDTIIHLEREVEEYKNEMKKTREEIEHATDKNLQMNRNISDLKISELAWSEKMDSLNDQIKELTKRKDNEISRLEIKLQRKCQEIENAMLAFFLVNV